MDNYPSGKWQSHSAKISAKNCHRGTLGFALDCSTECVLISPKFASKGWTQSTGPTLAEYIQVFFLPLSSLTGSLNVGNLYSGLPPISAFGLNVT